MITLFKLFESKLEKDILFIHYDDVGYIKRWLDEGGDVNVFDVDMDWTLLNLNANNSNNLTMKYLLEQGADPNIPNKNGTTPLLLSNDLLFVELLMSYGADLTFKNDDGVMALTYVLDNVFYLTRDAIIEFLENDYTEEYKNYKTLEKTEEYDI